MCHVISAKYPPLGVPAGFRVNPQGERELVHFLVFGKNVALKNGTHQTSIPYPIMRLVQDPNWQQPHSLRSIHCATPEPVHDGHFGSYHGHGSHRIYMLASARLYRHPQLGGACWHDAEVFVLGCEDCNHFDANPLDTFRDSYFWKERGFTVMDDPELAPGDTLVMPPPALVEKLYFAGARKN